MERTCEFCDKSKPTGYNNGTNCICELGWSVYMECQVAGTKDFFEQKRSKLAKAILKGERIYPEIFDEHNKDGDPVGSLRV